MIKKKFNLGKVNLTDLPTIKQLNKSAITAVATAVVILFTIILPAEYAYDPTGFGKRLGLTQMGEIKKELAEEAEADRKLDHNKDNNTNLINDFFNIFISKANAEMHDNWEDTISFKIKPGETSEWKFMISKDQTFEYQVIAEGGLINFDLHGHGNGFSKTHEKARGSKGASGSVTVDFDGEYGWFFRNRDKQEITITIKIKGEYTQFKEKI